MCRDEETRKRKRRRRGEGEYEGRKYLDTCRSKSINERQQCRRKIEERIQLTYCLNGRGRR